MVRIILVWCSRNSFFRNATNDYENELIANVSAENACEKYVIGLRTDGSVVMAGKMESRDCHPGVYAEGRHEITYVNFSEDGQLDTWTDMVNIDASGQFILGIHADGSPDMIGSYCYNP